MKEQLQLKNHLKEVRTEANLSQAQLAEMVGVSRNTISSIETGQFNPTAKLALILCIALDKKFEELSERIYRYFDEINADPIVYHWTYKMDEIDPDEAATI